MLKTVGLLYSFCGGGAKLLPADMSSNSGVISHVPNIQYFTVYFYSSKCAHVQKKSSLSKDKQISRSPCSFLSKVKMQPEYSRLNTEPYLGMVQLRLGMTEAPCASPSVGAERGERGHPKTRETWTGFGPLQVCYVS